MKLFIVAGCIWVFLLRPVLPCPTRDTYVAMYNEGRRCRKPCETNRDCRGSLKMCLCDGSCGKSCFNPRSQCSNPEGISDGIVLATFNTMGSKAYYSCREGYWLKGNGTRICHSDRKWSWKLPTCVAKRANYTIFKNSGDISSPNYPNKFPTGVDIKWNITVGVEMKVSVSLENDSLDIPIEGEYCGGNFLKIYDYVRNGWRERGKIEIVFDNALCGSETIVRPFKTHSNRMMVHFKSTSEIVGKGFKLHWKAIRQCNYTEFRCHNDNCIVWFLMCNGNNDCGDNSDEWECGNVASYPCGRQNIAPKFSWPSKIMGGNIATPGSWPWAVALSLNGEVKCGGSIIGFRWVLTAAHCVVDYTKDNIYAIVGAHNVSNPLEASQQKIGVKTVITHPRYNEYNIYGGYDIAILELERILNFSERVDKICLNSDMRKPYMERCVVVGWGRIAGSQVRSSVLRQVVVTSYTNFVCKDYWRANHNFPWTYPDKFICSGIKTGGGDACEGDSGGPLMCHWDREWHQAGIVSFADGCGQKGQAGFYTPVSSFLSWINHNMNNTNQQD